jgi:hypothetical protein
MIVDRPLDDEGIDGWRAGLARCRFCGHEWAAVFPVEADDLSLECPSCGLLESEIVEDYPPEAE